MDQWNKTKGVEPDVPHMCQWVIGAVKGGRWTLAEQIPLRGELLILVEEIKLDSYIS